MTTGATNGPQPPQCVAAAAVVVGAAAAVFDTQTATRPRMGLISNTRKTYAPIVLRRIPLLP